MHTEWKLFAGGIVFVPMGIVYGFMTEFKEWVGFPAMLLLAAMSLMVAFYLRKHGKVIGDRPEDRTDGEIAEKAGPVGTFAPWSWWPLVLGLAAATAFLGVAVGFWIFYIGAGLAAVAIIGWVFEHSRGDWAH